MFSQPIDEVSCYHRLNISKVEAGDSLTRYQKENGFVFAEGRAGALIFRLILGGERLRIAVSHISRKTSEMPRISCTRHWTMQRVRLSFKERRINLA
jgi:hypothetical protein